MGFLERFQFHFWDGMEMIGSLINKWDPVDCKTEKAYEKSLYNFLHEELEDIQVTRQYVTGRIRADLVVGDKVIIELKNNLDTTSKYQRLIGQLTNYRDWDGSVLLVLMGTTESNLRKQLDQYLDNEGLTGGYMKSDAVIVIEK